MKRTSSAACGGARDMEFASTSGRRTLRGMFLMAMPRYSWTIPGHFLFFNDFNASASFQRFALQQQKLLREQPGKTA